MSTILEVAIIAIAITVVGFFFGPMLYGVSRRLVPPQERRWTSNWGRLPVVKFTGNRDEKRYVETRRLHSLHDKNTMFEVRLYVNDLVVESRQIKEYGEAIQFHDTMVSRNGPDPNIGAAPVWHQLGRSRALTQIGMGEEEARARASQDLASNGGTTPLRKV